MKKSTVWAGVALALFLSFTPARAGGVLSWMHPVACPSSCQVAACQATPAACCDHVYVFLINGLDPLCLANLVGVRDYLHALGFCHAEYGELYHWWWFKKRVREVSRCDPQARIVLIGYSLGGGMVDSLCRRLEHDGVWIDLLVYLDAKSFTHNFHHRPCNVGQLLNVTSLSKLWNGKPLECAENVYEGTVWHFGSPTHPCTLDALAENLAALAARPLPCITQAPVAAGSSAATETPAQAASPAQQAP